jgi:hypothetical protein
MRCVLATTDRPDAGAGLAIEMEPHSRLPSEATTNENATALLYLLTTREISGFALIVWRALFGILLGKKSLG